MVDIALDPNMYYCSMSTADTLRKAADLGFRYVELSPNEEFHFWHRYPKADDAFVTEMRKAVRETGVTIRTLNPVFNWSSPDEAERRNQMRNWRRLLELADQLDVHEITSEFSGDPNSPRECEVAWYRSIEELAPSFERYGIRLNMEAHPYDFIELHDDACRTVRGTNLDWMSYEYCCPHTFHLSNGAGDVRRMIHGCADRLRRFTSQMRLTMLHTTGIGTSLIHQVPMCECINTMKSVSVMCPLTTCSKPYVTSVLMVLCRCVSLVGTREPMR